METLWLNQFRKLPQLLVHEAHCFIFKEMMKCGSRARQHLASLLSKSRREWKASAKVQAGSVLHVHAASKHGEKKKKAEPDDDDVELQMAQAEEHEIAEDSKFDDVVCEMVIESDEEVDDDDEVAGDDEICELSIPILLRRFANAMQTEAMDLLCRWAKEGKATEISFPLHAEVFVFVFVLLCCSYSVLKDMYGSVALRLVMEQHVAALPAERFTSDFSCSRPFDYRCCQRGNSKRRAFVQLDAAVTWWMFFFSFFFSHGLSRNIRERFLCLYRLSRWR